MNNHPHFLEFVNHLTSDSFVHPHENPAGMSGIMKQRRPRCL
jgi:hypothetical protein